MIIKNFFKGVLAGIGNIIPGISGSALLIIFDLYEKCILAISNIFKDFKKSIVLLLPIGLGAIAGIFLFSNIIEYCLITNETITYYIFFGLLLGTIPSLFHTSKKEGFKAIYLIPFFITFILGICLIFFKSRTLIQITPNFLNSFLIGLVVAFATVIPGISNTVLLTILGFYSTFLSSINNLNIKVLLPMMIGIAIGTFLLSKLLNFLFKKYRNFTYFGILGFVIATIPALIKNTNVINRDTIFGIIVAIMSFVLSYLLTKREP